MKTLISELKALVNNLQKRFKQDADIVEKDLDSVIFASKLLDISEFRFFHLAYAEWYGHDILDSQLEYVFADYMFESYVPPWVRHFTRKILSSFDQHSFDLKSFNIVRPEITKEKRTEGIRYMVLLSVVMVVFCVLLIFQAPPY